MNILFFGRKCRRDENTSLTVRKSRFINRTWRRNENPPPSSWWMDILVFGRKCATSGFNVSKEHHFRLENFVLTLEITLKRKYITSGLEHLIFTPEVPNIQFRDFMFRPEVTQNTVKSVTSGLKIPSERRAFGNVCESQPRLRTKWDITRNEHK